MTTQVRKGASKGGGSKGRDHTVDTFDLSMEPAVEFMEYDRSDEYLESTIEPEPAVF